MRGAASDVPDVVSALSATTFGEVCEHGLILEGGQQTFVPGGGGGHLGVVFGAVRTQRGGGAGIGSCWVVGNRDSEHLLDELLHCVARPAGVPDVVSALSATTFVEVWEHCLVLKGGQHASVPGGGSPWCCVRCGVHPGAGRAGGGGGRDRKLLGGWQQGFRASTG